MISSWSNYQYRKPKRAKRCSAH